MSASEKRGPSPTPPRVSARKAERRTVRQSRRANRGKYLG